MKRLIPSACYVGIISSYLRIVSPTTANGQSSWVSEFCAESDGEEPASLKSLRAGISVEKYNSQLGTKIVHRCCVVHAGCRA